MSRTGLNTFLAFMYLTFGGSFAGITLLLLANHVQSPASDTLSVAGGVAIALVLGSQRFITSAGIFLAAIAVDVLAQLALRGLAILSAGGAYGADSPTMSYLNTENDLLFAVLWLLFGVTHRAFKLQLDIDGNGHAQSFLLGKLAAAAAALTGGAIFLLHFYDGPLHAVDVKVLAPGVVFTVFLIAPGYRALAKSCWKRGILRVFSLRVMVQQWRETAIELSEATTQRRKGGSTLGSVNPSGSESGKYRQRQLPRAIAPTLAPDEAPRADKKARKPGVTSGGGSAAAHGGSARRKTSRENSRRRRR